jgi:hypothetical protein
MGFGNLSNDQGLTKATVSQVKPQQDDVLDRSYATARQAMEPNSNFRFMPACFKCGPHCVLHLLGLGTEVPFGMEQGRSRICVHSYFGSRLTILDQLGAFQRLFYVLWEVFTCRNAIMHR